MAGYALEDGAVFANRYRIVRCIARGGMGAVYEVVHIGTNRRRALKVMHSHILHSDELRERFHREAKVAAEVESDHIVDVFDAGIDDATEMPFLCMELLRGEELSRRLRRLGRIPQEELALHLHQTALALDRMHQAGIVHRDLKPENLFITEGKDGPPRIKVLDFGIAKVVADGVNSGPATLSVGTPLYMSPEQFQAKGKLTGASDVYALGMIAYTCLAGGPYWEDEARIGNIFAFGAIVKQGPVELASVRAKKRGVSLPPGFDEWFAAVTNVDPARRFSPATAATRALGELLGNAPPPARSPSAPFIPPPPGAPDDAHDALTMIPVSVTGVDAATGVPDPLAAGDRETPATVVASFDRVTAPAPEPLYDTLTAVASRPTAPSYDTVTAVPIVEARGSALPPAPLPPAPLPAASPRPAPAPPPVPDEPSTVDQAAASATGESLFEDDEGQTLVYKPNPKSQAELLRKIEQHREARRAGAPNPAKPWKGLTRTEVLPPQPPSARGAQQSAPRARAETPPQEPAKVPVPISAPAPSAPALAARLDDATTAPLTASSTSNARVTDAAPLTASSTSNARVTGAAPLTASSTSNARVTDAAPARPAAAPPQPVRSPLPPAASRFTLTPSGAVLPAPEPKPSDPLLGGPGFEEPLVQGDRGAKWRVGAAIAVAGLIGFFVVAVASSGMGPASDPEPLAPASTPSPATTLTETPSIPAPSASETATEAPSAAPSASSAEPAASSAEPADPPPKVRPYPRGPAPRGTGRPKYTQE